LPDDNTIREGIFLQILQKNKKIFYAAFSGIFMGSAGNREGKFRNE